MSSPPAAAQTCVCVCVYPVHAPPDAAMTYSTEGCVIASLLFMLPLYCFSPFTDINIYFVCVFGCEARMCMCM